MPNPLTTTVTTRRLTIAERARESIREWIRQDREQIEILSYEASLSKRNGEAEERAQELTEQVEFFVQRVKLLEAGLEVTAPPSPRPPSSQSQPVQKRAA